MMRNTPQTGLLGQVVVLSASAMLLVPGFMFSVIVLAVVIVAGRACRAAPTEKNKAADPCGINGLCDWW